MSQENCEVLIKADWEDEERPCERSADCRVKVGEHDIAVCSYHLATLRLILLRGYYVPVPLRLIERATD